MAPECDRVVILIAMLLDNADHNHRMGVSLMKSMNRWILLACLVLPFAACKKEEAVVVEAAPVAVPTTDDKAAWGAYLQDQVPRHMEGITATPFIYRVPSVVNPEDPTEFERLKEKAEIDIARGIVKGNLLAYAGLDPARTADLAVAAFHGVPANTMAGVRVVYIGDAANSERVKAAVSPAGVDYVFVEMN